MIVHVINTIDNALFSYLVNIYNLVNNEIPREVIELRGINSEHKNSIIEVFKKESINYFTARNSSNSNILILDNPDVLSYKLSKLISSNHLVNQIILSLEHYINPKYKKYGIGNRIFDFNKAYLMGILNVTPDSFSDGGNYFRTEDAINYGFNMIDFGVDIIDIGGESTRPGSEFISEEEEKRRVLPVIEKLLKIKSDLIISIDTTKSKVAESAIDLGAKIVNDISAMTLDKNMINICRNKNATVILMHMKGIPKTMQLNPNYNEVISEIYDHLYFRIQEAKENNIHNIIIDPGIGFGKSSEDNFTIIKRLNEFSTLGYPILIGLSRKSFIGKTLNLEINERDFPSSLLETISVMNNARIIRTHNVKNGRMLVDLINKII